MELRFLEVNGEKRLQVKCGLMTDEWEDVPIMKEEKNYSSEAPFKAIIKELRTRVAELEKKNNILKKTVSTPEQMLMIRQAFEESWKENYEKLKSKLSTLLKASEGMEKALVYYANPEDWDDGGFEGESAKIILCKLKHEAGYVVAAKALADFRAVKERL